MTQIIYSRVSGPIWSGGLQPLSSDLPASSLTRSRDTVNLDEPLWQKVVAGGVLAGVFFFAVKGLLRPGPRGPGPDAADELAAEARRIQRRNAARRRRSHAA